MSEKITQRLADVLHSIRGLTNDLVSEEIVDPEALRFTVMAKEDRAKVIPALKEQGLSNRDIAEILGVSHQSIGRELSGPNGPPTGPNGPPTGPNGPPTGPKITPSRPSIETPSTAVKYLRDFDLVGETQGQDAARKSVEPRNFKFQILEINVVPPPSTRERKDQINRARQARRQKDKEEGRSPPTKHKRYAGI